MKMRFFSILSVALCFLPFEYLSAQTYTLDLNATISKNQDAFQKGEQVKFVSITHDVTPMDEFGKTYDEFYLKDSKDRKYKILNKVDKSIHFMAEDVQDLWNAYIITDLIPFYRKKGYMNGLRRELGEESLNYIAELRRYELELNDPYLQNYLYSLLLKIAPNILIDGRLKDLNIFIQRSPSLNAGVYPNGTIVINTGLLSALHSEDELVAVLAHEVAHFVLDHIVRNIAKEEQRQARANFWTAFATGVTAVAEGIATVKNDHYIPGLPTAAMAIISSEVASKVTERLGMNYNHEQEYMADQLAVSILEVLGYNKDAMATALTRIEYHYLNENDYRIYLNSFTHPALVQRIGNIGIAQNLVNPRYEQMISFAISDVAALYYSDGKFRNAYQLILQNIRNNVATADDYLLGANCLMFTTNDNTSNAKIFDFINQAKILDENNLFYLKTEALAYLRINNHTKALSVLDEYRNRLLNCSTSYAASELNWAKQMSHKLKGMANVFENQ